MSLTPPQWHCAIGILTEERYWIGMLGWRMHPADIMVKKYDQIVVGGGIGGLSAAIHLASNGQSVCLLEKNKVVGGKCDALQWEGYHFDLGPSVLTLPHYLEELFTTAHRKLEDYLTIEPVEPGCRYFFSDRSVFDAPGKMALFEKALAETFPAEIEGFVRFRKYLQALWDISGPAFLDNPPLWPALRAIPWGKAIRNGLDLRPTSMMNKLDQYFKDHRLKQLFGRFATYNGSSPYQAHANFNVIAYAELAYGSWRCRGGMKSLVQALEKLALDCGVEQHTSCSVRKVSFDAKGKTTGVQTGEGLFIASPSVVVNQDAVTCLTSDMLDQHPKHKKWVKKWGRREPSSSAFVLLLALDRKHSDLACHNVLFSSDYAQEFKELFDQPTALSNPTVYVSIPSHAEERLAPPGGEGWFVLVNAPSLEKYQTWETEEYANKIVKILLERTSLKESEIKWRKCIHPPFYQEQYGAHQGSLYGMSSNRMLDAFLRAPNTVKSAPGLFFCGGSAHPGGGIPLVIKSGRFAAEASLRSLK